jgi:hypothetical protein
MLKAEALVAGVPLPDMDKTISIRVIRAFYYKGVMQKVGAVLDYPAPLAREVIQLGKAERYVAPEPEPKTEPAPKARKEKE